jgi:hypothetical protein
MHQTKIKENQDSLIIINNNGNLNLNQSDVVNNFSGSIIGGKRSINNNHNNRNLFEKHSFKLQHNNQSNQLNGQENKILSEFNEEKINKCSSNFIYNNFENPVLKLSENKSNIIINNNTNYSNTCKPCMYNSSMESNKSLVKFSNNNNSPINNKRNVSVNPKLKSNEQCSRKYSKDDSNLNSNHYSERTDKSYLSGQSHFQDIYGKLLLKRINPMTKEIPKRKNSN